MTRQSHIIKVPNKFTKVWNSKKSDQIWYGGRGSSKSWSKAIYFLCRLKEPKYCRPVFARDTQKNVRKAQYQLCIDLSRKYEAFHNQFQFKDSTMEIICKANGNFATCGSFEQPDTLRSVADPTDFWAEEPITRKGQISRDDFFDIKGSLRNSHNVRTTFHFTFNPISKKTWIYKDFFQTKKHDVEILHVNYWDNPFCPQTLKVFLESLKDLDEARYKVDCLGNWGIGQVGVIFPYEIAEEMPDVQGYGLDFGFNNPCALVGWSIEDAPGQSKQNLYWKEILYEPGHTSASLIDRFKTLGVKKNLPMICDNARPEMIADLRRAGFNAKPCKKYKGSVQDGISEVQKYRLHILQGSQNLMDEADDYVWALKSDGSILDEPDGVNHGMDAGRYGLEATRRRKLEVEDLYI